MDEHELEALVGIVERHPTARLLVDETYRELAYDAPPLPLAAARSDRVVGVSSLSKAYGLPGLRIGWLTVRDRAFAEQLLAAKEQILLAGSLLDETMAARVLARRDAVLPGMLAAVRERRDAVTRWMTGSEHFEWHPPQAGVVCFPRLSPGRGADPDVFHAAALRDHGTYVGPGHWFEQNRRFFRLGFGWPGMEELVRGLDGLTAAARAAEP
jgi:aspartate/methionine/tyrosine aminotransferase